MLYLKSGNTSAPWTGEAVGEIRYPLNIEQLWSPADLAVLNLFAPFDPGVPEGMGVVAHAVAVVEDQVRVVYQLEPVAPAPRSKRQINAALIVAGVTTDPEAWMDGILGHIADPVLRALALNDRRHAPSYERDNPLFNDPALLAAAGLNVAQVDALWAAAGELPA
jgi:hypothetical protein